jgi:hypothetical protein
MRPHRGARSLRAVRSLLPAVLALAFSSGALAQTPVASTTHTVVYPGQPPAVEHNFTITSAGTYSVTLTDLGAKLPTPAPLASVAMAVTQGSSVVGTPVSAAGTPITFTATANTTYTIHVVGILGNVLGSGPIEEDVTGSSGEVFSSIDTLAVPTTQTASQVGILAAPVTVTSSGSYTVTLTDLQFPAALQVSALLLVDSTAGTSVTLSGPSNTSMTLNAGDDCEIIAYGVEASGQPGGLYGVSVTPASGPAIYSTLVPVGAVTQLQTSASGTPEPSFSLSASATLTLSDLAFPTTPLASVGAAVVDATAQTVAASVTAVGAQNISSPNTSDTFEVFAYAIAQTPTPDDGSYAVTVQQGTSFPFVEAQAVGSPSDTAIQPFSFDTIISSAGTYVATLTDFKFPTALTADALAVVQDGKIVNSTNAAGSFNGTLSAGPVTLLAFGEEGGSPASPGLMGIDLSPSGGGSAVFDTTEGIGTGFSSTTFTVTSNTAVQANVADLKFPAALASLNLAVTSGTSLIGQIASAGSSGSFPFTASGNTTYTVNVLAQPPTPTNSQESAGTYAMSVDPSPTVTLTASSASVTSGGTVSLTWNAQNATSCTASASPSNSAWSGSEATGSGGPVTTSAITATTTFTLSCTGAGGTASGTATVNVTAASSSSGHGGGGSMDFGILAALATLAALRLRGLRASPKLP